MDKIRELERIQYEFLEKEGIEGNQFCTEVFKVLNKIKDRLKMFVFGEYF